VDAQQVWDAVDAYLEAELAGEDAALRAARASITEAGLPPINVTPLQGKFLYILARLAGATNVLEVGTLAGYSTIWLGRALPPGGRVVSLELEPRHAEVARANLERAGLAGAVEVRVGPALELLPGVVADFGVGAFDFAFIDADKTNNAAYFSWALRLVRPGGAVVVDNVVRQGQVADGASTDPAVAGTRLLFQTMADLPEVPATALQTVGSKGYDGFALALVPGRAGPRN
jgi:predicted O-methyltransferase YrrM